MYLSEDLQKKWEGVLDHPDLPKITDPYKKAVVEHNRRSNKHLHPDK